MKMAARSNRLTEYALRWYNRINGSMHLPAEGLQTIK